MNEVSSMDNFVYVIIGCIVVYLIWITISNSSHNDKKKTIEKSKDSKQIENFYGKKNQFFGLSNYKNVCWNCKAPIDSNKNRLCSECGKFYVCGVCGKCLCDNPLYSKHKKK